MESSVPQGKGKRRQPAAAVPPAAPRPRNPHGLRGAASPKGKPAGQLSEPSETEPEFRYTKLHVRAAGAAGTALTAWKRCHLGWPDT